MAISEKQAAYRNDLIQKKLTAYRAAWYRASDIDCFGDLTEAVRTVAVLLAMPQSDVDSYEASRQIDYLKIRTNSITGMQQEWADAISARITPEIAEQVDQALTDLAMDEVGIWRDLTVDELRDAIQAVVR